MYKHLRKVAKFHAFSLKTADCAEIRPFIAEIRILPHGWQHEIGWVTQMFVMLLKQVTKTHLIRVISYTAGKENKSNRWARQKQWLARELWCQVSVRV